MAPGRSPGLRPWVLRRVWHDGFMFSKGPRRAWETDPGGRARQCGWGEGMPGWTPAVVGKAPGHKEAGPLRNGSAGGLCPGGGGEAAHQPRCAGRTSRRRWCPRWSSTRSRSTLRGRGTVGGGHPVEALPLPRGQQKRRTELGRRAEEAGKSEGTLQWHPAALHSGHACPRSPCGPSGCPSLTEAPGSSEALLCETVRGWCCPPPRGRQGHLVTHTSMAARDCTEHRPRERAWKAGPTVKVTGTLRRQRPHQGTSQQRG